MYIQFVNFAAYVLPLILVLILTTIVERQKQVVNHFDLILIMTFSGYVILFVIAPAILTVITLKYKKWPRLSNSSGSLVPINPKGIVESHKIFSSLTPIYATAFIILLATYYLIFGLPPIDGPLIFTISEEEPNDQIKLKVMT